MRNRKLSDIRLLSKMPQKSGTENLKYDSPIFQISKGSPPPTSTDKGKIRMELFLKNMGQSRPQLQFQQHKHL